jgi:hypothetical protein
LIILLLLVVEVVLATQSVVTGQEVAEVLVGLERVLVLPFLLDHHIL